MKRTVTTVETQRWDAEKSDWVPESKSTTTVDEAADSQPKYVPMPYPVYPYQGMQPYYRIVTTNTTAGDPHAVADAITAKMGRWETAVRSAA